MNRTGLAVTLVIAAITGLVFGLYPQLDLAISRFFFGYRVGVHDFALRLDPWVLMLQSAGVWLVTSLAAAPLAALLIKLVVPRAKLLISARAMVFLLSVIVLGPGLVVNAIFKEHWNRPRPADVVDLGGTRTFMPWWDTRGDCHHNCAFVSGDVSMATWTMASAVLTPPAWRALAYGAAAGFAVAAGVMRMAFGAHFFTDAVFAGVLTFLTIWLLHGLIYRWPRTRLTDDDIESAMERGADWWRERFWRLVEPTRPHTDQQKKSPGF